MLRRGVLAVLLLLSACSTEREQDWFEVRRVLPGVTAILEPHHPEGVASYLVEGEAMALLLDTGTGTEDIARVVAGLTDRPMLVVNSHDHYDHSGGNGSFERILRPADGEMIDLGGRTLEVIATPGHSPDSLCLLDRDAGLLFTGDTFYAGNLYACLPGSDLTAYRDSMRRLAALENDLAWLLPAHTPPTRDTTWLGRVAAGLGSIVDGSAPGFAARSPFTDGLITVYEFAGFAVLGPQ